MKKILALIGSLMLMVFFSVSVNAQATGTGAKKDASVGTAAHKKNKALRKSSKREKAMADMKSESRKRQTQIQNEKAGR